MSERQVAQVGSQGTSHSGVQEMRLSDIWGLGQGFRASWCAGDRELTAVVLGPDVPGIGEACNASIVYE